MACFQLGRPDDPRQVLSVIDPTVERPLHVARIANGSSDGLHAHRIVEIRTRMDVGVAEPLVVFDHRHRRVLADEADQLLAAAGDDEIDVAVHLDQSGDPFAECQQKLY